MKKLIMLGMLAFTLVSCADAQKRQEMLEKKYPYSKVEPATGIIQERGYEYIVIDSTKQIIAVSFYPFSETKIMNLRNIR